VSKSVKGAGTSADGPTRLVRLAERSLPRRVRFLLDGLLERTVYFESALGMLCTEVEQRLFKQADNARSNEQQARLFEAIREIKRGKADIAPRFLMHLESSLATFDQTPGEANATSGSSRGERQATKLELVDSRELEITLAIQEIGNRAEIRHTGALYLLGHRLGLVAGRAAFESDEVPLGPVALARALQHALLELDLEQVDRIQVFHDFDSIVMGPIGQFYETINRYLAEQGVLPGLRARVPTKARPPTKPNRTGIPRVRSQLPWVRQPGAALRWVLLRWVLLRWVLLRWVLLRWVLLRWALLRWVLLRWALFRWVLARWVLLQGLGLRWAAHLPAQVILARHPKPTVPEPEVWKTQARTAATRRCSLRCAVCSPRDVAP